MKKKATQAEKQRAETIHNLSEAARLKKQAAKELKVKLDESEKALKNLIEAAPREHQGAAIAMQNKVNKLIAELKGGADVNDIVAKLEKLRV